MQIDFHHAVTYVLARLAGFPHDDSHIIAYAAQYVDDAKNNGLIDFADGTSFYHIASAHAIWDAGNLRVIDNREVWVPFHFLPGNNGRESGEALGEPMVKRLVCRVDSPLARDMWSACKDAKDQPNWRQRLGITTHVYADTFAHYGFVGVINEINKVSELKFTGTHLRDTVAGWISGAITEMENLGHGCVFKCPDAPYLQWSYHDHDGNLCQRDNASLFARACDRIFYNYLAYRDGATERQIPEPDRKLILETFYRTTDQEGDVRHRHWLALIREGRFSFGGLSKEQAASLEYAAKGERSWKLDALDTTRDWDAPGATFPHKPNFDQSNWKLFHTALISHQELVLRKLLPLYRISLST